MIEGSKRFRTREHGFGAHLLKSHHVCEVFIEQNIFAAEPPRHEVSFIINIFSLCLSAFVAILSGLSGLSFKKN
jgi:hypothetical protein